MNIGTSGAPSYADIGTRLAPIASPNFSGTPKIGGVNIATSADVTTATSGAVTTTSLATTLASYVTTTALAAYAYVTTTDFNTALTPYATKVYVTGALGSYVTLTSLATTLGNYVTKIAADASYVTITALAAYAPLASPALTGAPTITPTGGTASAVATQAWVAGQGYSANTITSFWMRIYFRGLYYTNYSNINTPLITGWYRLEMLFPPDTQGPHQINWNVPNQTSNTMFTSLDSVTKFVFYFYIYDGTYITNLLSYTNGNPGENGFYYFTLIANVPLIVAAPVG